MLMYESLAAPITVLPADFLLHAKLRCFLNVKQMKTLSDDN